LASPPTGAARLEGLRLQHALARALKRDPENPALKSHLKTVQMLNARLRQLAMEERLGAMLKRRCPRPDSCEWPNCTIRETRDSALG